MKMIYEKLYMFFTIGDKVFRDEVMGCPNKNGLYIIQKVEGSAYDFFKIDPPTVDTLDVVPCDPFKLVRYYPMFSKNGDFENYVRLMKETKRDEIDYYKGKIEVLEEHLEKDYDCEVLRKQELLDTDN